LVDAHARRDESRWRIAAGVDPSIEKKRAQIAVKYAAATTFEAIAKE
jgi:hypothetical protein